MKKNHKIIYGMGLGLCLAFWSAPCMAYSINLTNPEKNEPLTVQIDSERSAAYGWKSGQSITIQVAVQKENGEKLFIADASGKNSWQLQLDYHASGSLKIQLDQSVYSGAWTVLGNNKSLFKIGDALNPDGYYWVEKIREYRAADGVTIRVHYTDQALERYNAKSEFPREAMDAAVQAYQTITDFQGFNSNGYSFAHPDIFYAMDPDKTIDVFLGDPAGFNGYEALGLRNNLFKDAPCFDTIKLSETAYQAVILLPANYHEFIRNWEKINPSPLGRRNIEIDLRGTLIHEMLHVILFYYNKNLNKVEGGTTEHTTVASKNLDWYVEGLARYFETFAGARHDFYSQGFKQTLPDRIRFSRGGSNYFMRYPDQAFTQLRYENALFWRYLDDRYGMEAIEALSRDFRGLGADIKTALEKMTQRSFETLLMEYAKAILLKDFGLKDDSEYLNEVARCRLLYKNHEWHLLGARGEEMSLGKTCETDWVGRWENTEARFSDPSVAGDNTRISDVSGWATDYFEMRRDPNAGHWPKFKLRHQGLTGTLLAQVMGVTKGGGHIEQEPVTVLAGSDRMMDLSLLARSQGLGDEDVEKVFVLITNSDPDNTIEYNLTLIS